MASDPLADFQNMIGIQGLMGPNPYLTYQGAIPMAGYRGAPTDAQGNPIQSFTDAQKAHDAWSAANPAPQGTTLNSGPQPKQPPQYMYIPPYYMGTGGQGGFGSVYTGMGGGWTQMPRQQAQAPAPQAPAPTNPVDMRQAYLDALSNPGKVSTPGAQMYPGAQQTGAPQPSVLQQFLANNQPSTGAGGYTNQPFFSTLRALQAQGGAT